MKGLVFLGDKKIALNDFDDPAPAVGEVVVQIKASGMCGSDLHTYRAPHDATISNDHRMIGGHEPCGVVVAVGNGVTDRVAKVGDRMMVHHYHGCSVCKHCRTGWPQLCNPETRVVYNMNAHGSHAPYMKVRADTLIPLHDSLSFAAGAAISCGTGTAWGAIKRLQLTGEDTVVVFGQGPVGLSVTLLATALGARVIAVDLDNERLKLAKEFGAVSVLNATSTDVVSEIRSLTDGVGATVAVETSGSSQAAAQALGCVDVWGKVCLVGLGSRVAFDVRAFLDRQLTVMTSYTMSTVGQMECADFVVKHQIDLEQLFTDQWRLDRAEEAYVKFDLQSSGKGVFLF